MSIVGLYHKLHGHVNNMLQAGRLLWPAWEIPGMLACVAMACIAVCWYSTCRPYKDTIGCRDVIAVGRLPRCTIGNKDTADEGVGLQIISTGGMEKVKYLP